MRKLACLLMLVAGCGSQVGSVGDPSIASTVARCRQFGLTDADIDTMFIATQANVDLGFTKAESVITVLDGCLQFTQVLDCDACLLSIVDVVYGN